MMGYSPFLGRGINTLTRNACNQTRGTPEVGPIVAVTLEHPPQNEGLCQEHHLCDTTIVLGWQGQESLSKWSLYDTTSKHGITLSAIMTCVDPQRMWLPG